MEQVLVAKASSAAEEGAHAVFKARRKQEVEGKREAKKDDRIRSSGRLLRFHSNGQDWPRDPPSAFYDWVYINALQQHQTLIDAVMRFAAFTDIEFNPKRQVNCQAYCVALFVALKTSRQIEEALSSPTSYLRLMTENRIRI